MRAYFRAQQPIVLVVWVRHDEPGNEPENHDHHLMLAMTDSDYESGDPGALEWGITNEVPRADEVGWIDVGPISAIEPLRSFGHVLWEREGSPEADLDPLEFRFIWDPLEASAGELDAFARLLAVVHPVVRVEGSREQFWKGDSVLRDSTHLYVGYDKRCRELHDTFELVKAAWRESGLPMPSNRGLTLGLPSDPRVKTPVLYSAQMDERDG